MIRAVVEGSVDEAAIARLAEEYRIPINPIQVKGGATKIKQKMSGYCAAAYHWPVIVVTDFDNAYICASAARQDWIPDPSSPICLRFAKNSIEAWLMADFSLGKFLRVPLDKWPQFPEELAHPKRYLQSLVRNFCTSREIKEQIVVPPNSRRAQGPGYADLLSEYCLYYWNPEKARLHSRSLDKAISAMSAITPT